MSKRVKGPQEQKSYEPSKQVKTMIREKLQLLEKDKSSKTWDKKKFDFIEKLFQSSADMIYFLEMTAANSKLREVFEKDLEDLLDVRPYRLVHGLPSTIGMRTGIFLSQTNLIRLIYASLIPYEKDYKNFRLKLLTQLQMLIYEKMGSIIQDEYGYSTQIAKSVMEDMQRSLGWVAMLSHPKDYEKENPSRVINFRHPYKR